MKLKPCKKCGSTDIELGDCGYNTFNPCWGKCLNCGFEVKIAHGPADPTKEDLTGLWNNGQKLNDAEKLKIERNKTRRLRRELKKQVQPNE